MKIEAIFVERAVEGNPFAKRILRSFPTVPVRSIEKIESVFGAVKKPYLDKRDGLQLFVGEKKGQLVKEAPDAYGPSCSRHYYFIHAYNCLYACEYCYLQGYFDSPDLVFFVNHDDIVSALEDTLVRHPSEQVVFHAGEFSDSLALSHITREWDLYWRFFESNPRATLELRTKSANLKAIACLKPMKNIVVSFSLSPESVARRYDKKAPSLGARLKAINTLSDLGFQIGIHFDPILFEEDWFVGYKTLVKQVFQALPLKQLAHVSLGVVRFSQKGFREANRNYPGQRFLSGAMSKSRSKWRYSSALRAEIFEKMQEELLLQQVPFEKVYRCMEEQKPSAKSIP